MKLRIHYARYIAELPVPLWFALLINVVFMVMSMLIGIILAPCIDYIGF